MDEVLGGNEKVSAHALDLHLEAVPSEDVVSGSPRQATLELGNIGGTEVGVWELRSGTVTDTEVDEFFVVVSGGATVQILGEDNTVTSEAILSPGDVMRLVAGTRTRWIVDDFIRKVYIA